MSMDTEIAGGTTADPEEAGRLLASAVSSNARFSLVSGTVLLVGAPLLAPLLGPPRWLIAAVGVGVAALAAVLVVVAVFATTQGRGRIRLGTGAADGTTPLVLRAGRVIAVPAPQAWAAVSDDAEYARFADGIASTRIVGGDRTGMVRVCTDDRGGTWSETCTLWEDGQRYVMTVDVSSYPWYYRVLIADLHQTWQVGTVAGGARLDLRFDGRMRLGVIGRIAGRVLGREGRLDDILAAYERELVSGRALAG